MIRRFVRSLVSWFFPTHFLALAVLAIIATLAACSNTCSAGSVCGSGNVISPTSTTTTTTTTTTNASPTPTATPGQSACVPQTAPYVCTKGSHLFGTILDAVQAGVPIAPEPIYVAALVKALNADPNICAQAGPSSDEVTIKARVSNAQSETWDVVRADGASQALPVNVCAPSRF